MTRTEDEMLALEDSFEFERVDNVLQDATEKREQMPCFLNLREPIVLNGEKWGPFMQPIHRIKGQQILYVASADRIFE